MADCLAANPSYGLRVHTKLWVDKRSASTRVTWDALRAQKDRKLEFLQGLGSHPDGWEPANIKFEEETIL